VLRALECELCGKNIAGKATRIKIEGVLLLVCSECAKKYSEFIVRERPQRTRRVILKKSSKRPWSTRNIELDYDIVDDYSDRIREAREMLGLTRELLAREIGEKESVIRRLEAGTLIPTVSMARKLEQVLRIKLLVPRGYEEEVSVSSGRRHMELTLGDIVIIKEKKRERKKYGEEKSSTS